MPSTGLAKWKATFFFNLDSGGFSESLYAGDGGPTTYGTMMAAARAILPFRMKLSQTAKVAPPCTNPLTCVAIRVTNLQIKRATFLQSVLGQQFDSFNNGPWPVGNNGKYDVGAQTESSNDAPNVAAKIQLTDGLGHNTNELLHGFPNDAYDNDPTRPPPSGFTRLLADIDSKWLENLAKWSDKVLEQSLGWRWNFNIWVPASPPYNNPPWPPGTVGDSRPIPTPPDEPVYNADQNTWTFTMRQPLPQNKMRVICRGFKSLDFLNGRQVGIAGPLPNQITIQTLVREGTGWDGTGTICPETYNVFSPLPTRVLGPTGLPGCQFNFMTTKKIGRPFELERGRIRRRAR